MEEKLYDFDVVDVVGIAVAAFFAGAYAGARWMKSACDKREAKRTDARIQEWLKEAQERCDRENGANGIPGY